MEITRVAPELRPALRRLPRLPARALQRAWVRRLVRAAAGRRSAPAVPGVRLETPATSGEDPAPTGLRVHHPPVRRSDAALLWVHGGGYVIGSPAQDDALCSATALQLGIPVVAVGYRLAPEHPFPAALDDCRAGWVWVQEHAAALRVDPARVVVGGQSAGGGLAAALAQRLHDEPGPDPLAQWLFCPMLDDRTAARRDLDAVGHRVWDNRLNHLGWSAHLGTEPGAPSAPPYAVPARRDDLAGLPPAWVGVGDIDLFHDEDQRYAERLREAGVEATFHTVPGAPHGFEAWASDTGIARDHMGVARSWLGRVVGADGPAGGSGGDHRPGAPPT